MKCAIVTGANTGIGYETAKALAAKGLIVVLACRDASKAEAAIARIRQALPDTKLVYLPLDLVYRDSIRSFASMFTERFGTLHLLINSAGVLGPAYTITANNLELQFDANYLGHFYLTSLLFDCLQNGARIVNVSSLAGKDARARIRLDNINFTGIYDDERWRLLGISGMGAYRQSKLANILFTMELSHRIIEAGMPIKAVVAHPGASATNIIRNMSPLVRALSPLLRRVVNVSTPEDGARPIVYASLHPEVESGDFIGPTGMGERTGEPGPVELPAKAFDQDLCRRLWEYSESELGITFAI